MERPCLLLTFFGFFIFLILPGLSCPEYQKQALLQFKSSILAITSSLNYSSDDSQLLQSWNSSSSCCGWDRVACNDHSPPQVVNSLYLDGLFANIYQRPWVESTILTPLFHIRSLEDLSFSDNNLQGEIPGVGFANLSSLVSLYMEGNNFSGPIPPQLFHLPLLQDLYLFENSLSGQLPADIGNLTSLQRLILSGNKISGPIPPQVFYLPLLEILILDGNSLSGEVPTGEEEIGNLTTSLQVLSLFGNEFSDGMLVSVLCLKGLEYLDLSHNDLSMEIPTEIGNLLPNIVTLYLDNNRLAGGIPSSLQILSKLNILHLQNNFLTGEIPSWLFDFRELWSLFIGGNRLIWNNSVEIAPNPRPFSLSLKSCGLIGEVPKWISTQTGLDFLDLSKNKLQGAFPQSFLKMKLKGLILSDNEFNGSFPPDLFSRLDYLVVLALSRNHLSGELPRNIRYATFLRILTLSDNNFSGPIPQSLINGSFLRLLDLSRNRFSGPFPVFYPKGQLELAYIDFSYNDFSGEVPYAFPEKIRFLALGGNKFSGGLPLNLTKLSKLQRLELEDNNLTGELPNFLSQISTLQVLNLRNNSFQGSIPQSICNLSNLQILDVSNNNLTGEIPKGFHNLVGMINEPPNSPSPITLYTISVDFTSSWVSQGVQISLEFRDLVVNWKKSKQGLSTDKLNIYTLLDLSNNQLSGQIPTSLGALKALKLLNISRNKLSGMIPASLGDLVNIETLDLSHNNLSGSIPPTLTKLQQLTILDVSNNELRGRIPDGGQMGTMILDPNYFANNSGLCGIQIRLSCPKDNGLPIPPTATKKHESWFLCEGVWIGYPVGLLFVIGIMFGTRYFSLPPPSNH